jgi:2-polyprenyl-6-methoxyphenol hydroxylase-like FAD-dependent oxidoreductase
MVPQWDLLNLLAEAGEQEPTFTLRMRTEAVELLRDGRRVRGVRYRTADGATGEITADLTVGCDGRSSMARDQVALPAKRYPVPMDVWWFSLPRRPNDESGGLLPVAGHGRMVVVIPREDHHQIGYLTRKGTEQHLRERGIEAFRRDLGELLPWLADRVDELESMDQVKVLDVKLDRAKRWHVEGLLCIGDAAHAMSPIGGVGINLAIQDAVAAATILAEPLRRRDIAPGTLARVRLRRLVPTTAVQLLQRIIHRVMVAPVLRGRRAGPPKPLVALLRRFPALSIVPAYLVGIGIRPEHAPRNTRRSTSTPNR